MEEIRLTVRSTQRGSIPPKPLGHTQEPQNYTGFPQNARAEDLQGTGADPEKANRDKPNAQKLQERSVIYSREPRARPGSDQQLELSRQQNSDQNKWISCSPMLQRRVYHSMAAIQRKLYVLGGNDLDYNNDRILVSHTDSYNLDTDQWTHCNFNLLTGQNESGVAVHNGRIYLVGGYSIWTNEPLAFIQVLDVSREGKEEVFYGPTLPFASNGIAACFLPAPYFTCPNLQTLQVPHHRIGTI
ncbi:kelch-like protein 32 [Dipodomys merriami]|uniref:kelch-like protein 32 n=1 Tax=Dipodomys merriami TaxID=94247 RepID=UPI003855C3C4